MKNKTYLFLGIAIMAVALAACKKDDNENENYKVYEFFEQNGVPTQTFVVEAQQGDTIITAKGAIITFQPNAFKTQGGQIVTGNVVVSVREIYDKTDMLLSNAATTSNGNLLVSRGELFIKATQNNNELLPAQPYQLAVLTTDVVSVNPQLFLGEIYSTAADSGLTAWALNWVPDTTSVFFTQNFAYKYYVTYANSFTWINFDYNVDANQADSVTAILPAGFDETNTLVYVSLDGQESIGNIFNLTPGSSTFRFRNIQRGSNIHILTISFKNNKYYYSVAPATIDYNVTLNLTPVQTTESQIAVAFDALP